MPDVSGLLSPNIGQLYGNPNLQDPAVQQAIANRGLQSFFGTLGSLAGPSRMPINIGGAIGQAAGAMGPAEDAAIKARTDAAQATLYGAQGQQALASIDAMKALIAKLSGTNLGKYMYGNQPLMPGATPNQPGGGGVPPGGGGGVSADGAGTAALMSGPLGDKINYYANYWGVDPNLYGAMINAESSGKVDAVSPKGAIGLAQIMPGNFAKYGVKNPYDIDQNLNAGAHILADNMKLAGGDTDLALRYYQGGPNQKAWGKDNEAYPALVRSRLPPPPGTPADQTTVEPAYNPEKGQTQTAGGPGPAPPPAAPAQPAAAPAAPPPPVGGGGGGPPAAASMETPEHAAWKQRVFEQMLGGPPAGPEPPAGGGLLAPQGAAAAMPPPAAPPAPTGQGAALMPPPGAAQQASVNPGILARAGGLLSQLNPMGSAQAAEAGPSATAAIPPRQPNLVAPPGGLLGPTGGASPPNPGKNFYTPNSAPSVFAPNTGAPPPGAPPQQAAAPVAPPPVPPTPPAAAPPSGAAPAPMRAPQLPNVPLPLGPQDMNDIANMAMLADLAKFPTVGQMLMNSPAFKATVEGMSQQQAARYKPIDIRGNAFAGYPGGPMVGNPGQMQEFYDPGTGRMYKAPWMQGMPTPTPPGSPGSNSVWSQPSEEEKSAGKTKGEYTSGVPGEPKAPPGAIPDGVDPDKPIPSPLNANRPYSSFIPPVSQQAHTTDLHTYGQVAPEWQKTSATIADAGAAAQQAEGQLMMIARAFQITQTGPMAMQSAELGGIMQKLGLGAPASFGNLAALQTALHSNYRETLTNLKAVNNRFTGNEFKVTAQAGEDAGNQPEANYNILTQDLAQLHQLQAFAGDWNQAQTMVASNGQHWVNPESFKTVWNQQNPLTGFVTSARQQITPFMGMPGNPRTDASGATNAAGARAIPPGLPAGSTYVRTEQDGRQRWRLPGPNGQEVLPSRTQ